MKRRLQTANAHGAAAVSPPASAHPVMFPSASYDGNGNAICFHNRRQSARAARALHFALDIQAPGVACVFGASIFNNRFGGDVEIIPSARHGFAGRRIDIRNCFADHAPHAAASAIGRACVVGRKNQAAPAVPGAMPLCAVKCHVSVQAVLRLDGCLRRARDGAGDLR